MTFYCSSIVTSVLKYLAVPTYTKDAALACGRPVHPFLPRTEVVVPCFRVFSSFPTVFSFVNFVSLTVVFFSFLRLLFCSVAFLPTLCTELFTTHKTTRRSLSDAVELKSYTCAVVYGLICDLSG